MRLLSLAVCLTGMLAIPPSLLAQGSQQQYIIQLRLLETDDAANKDRILAAPTIAATSGRKFSFLSGGEIMPDPKFGGEILFYGTQVEGVIRESADGQTQLHLAIEVSEALPPEEENEVTTTFGSVYRFRMPLPLARPKQIRFESNGILEIRAQLAEPATARSN
ncbi:hypothetical protein LOC68_26635 [Blastopirellula sp. JC732]|uniref:SHSP domain-containing protein n=1 Tax=Blastopirellula sediminis TaxID=2894196 RepID=A0A9X1MSX0_9BACT|nr:hypothetical protein [Blastopirellula sediminis]MCC9604712.1 hypothetical protein [Blastopirellula sediminis]MCC9631989.1 hypothetical protein [Blastopirellula sediminis]